jgi:predicted TIM-barrel fold metal-dependent hydrolase
MRSTLVRIAALIAATAVAAPIMAAPAADYYTMADFGRVEKIDAHMHIHGKADRFMAQASADRFSLLTINVDYPDFPSLPKQLEDAVSLKGRYPGRVAFAGAFSVADFNSPGWTEAALGQIDAAIAKGAVGIKVWKNIGMVLEDPDGRYVMLDDKRFEPIWQRIERNHIVLLAHQAEPLNCWLPLDRMTVRGDREYFQAHPQYYMYEHPEMPAHDAILAARDRMLQAHPNLAFDAVHLASLEWDVDRVADFLDRFPAARVDMAARLVHLEYQASKDREKVRRFLIKYQDRILYGSDDAYGPGDADPAPVKEVHHGWVEDWKFLATREPMHSGDFEAGFEGMQLPRTVVDKIYRENAEALFKGGWKSAAGRRKHHPAGGSPASAHMRRQAPSESYSASRSSPVSASG